MMENSVLVVDDDRQLGDLWSRVLRDRGFEVTTCRSGAEALEKVCGKSFRVIITDHRMPGMLGTELVKKIRIQCPEAFIIGNSSEFLEKEFLAASADVFLLKPFSYLELVSLVEQGLKKIDCPGD